MPIVLACIIVALLMAPALHLMGLKWRWALLCDAILAAGLGTSAAESIGLF